MMRLAALTAALTLAALPALGQTRPVDPNNPASVLPIPLPGPKPRVAPIQPSDYGQEANWLCLPGRDDICAAPLDATVVAADGSTTVERFVRAENPPVDCVYIYPTVSTDDAPNSDMQAGEAERRATLSQFARFGSVCRTFAPIYRQITAKALDDQLAGKPSGSFNLAYADVRAAIMHYLENHNRGRPFVLIGHSQGGIHVQRFLKEAVDNAVLADLMLSAMVIGWNHEVPDGKDVGYTLESIPLCRTPTQTGCVVSYMSFRAGATPAKGSLFARASRPQLRAACTNPAALGGSAAPVPLDAYFPTATRAEAGAQPQWITRGPNAKRPITTPFVKLPGLVSGQCVRDGDTDYLAITVNADRRDRRVDDIPGDLPRADGTRDAAWGLHVVDVNLAQGDLINLVRSQWAERSKSWQARPVR